MSSRRRTALTLTEVIVVVAIVVTLAAIVFPTFSKAKDRAKVAKCRSNLRQLWTGLMLYREAEGAVDTPADSVSMRWPMHLSCVMFPADCWENNHPEISCGGVNPRLFPHAGYSQMWAQPATSPLYNKAQEDAWIAYLEKAGSGAVIISDPNHQLHYPANQWTIQRVTAVAFDGSIRTRIRRGNPMNYAWWLDGQ